MNSIPLTNYFVQPGEYAITFDQYMMHEYNFIYCERYDGDVIVFWEVDQDGCALKNYPSRQCAEWVNKCIVLDADESEDVPAFRGVGKWLTGLLAAVLS